MEEAVSLMEKHQFRHLPVTDDSSLIIGILSDRDVVRARNPIKPGFDKTAQVSEYMSWPVITINQNLFIREAAQRMIDEKVSALLVTNDSKEIVGIVTSEDMLKELVKILSEPSRLELASFSPVVSELLREAQSAGL
jgi:acetoin utilization protein AcuB